ncbi:DUF262 domain-containing protein [Pseudonocardia alni]|uniref:GmrSD restriction endonucleases N-terminal domain-containing protein n=1 Tax=Pseudonocardia alni TaxID=33907 RepID=A0A852W5H8_PSEA5|nr:DUF262 domain-containing protein [Pseudonocardia antarctica]NYG04368.1 hypothetical protein [Pseudonocardia antarctica]
MGFQTPLYELAEYLKKTTSGKIQLPDFQRGYKWEDERIRQLLVTVLRGHPLGVVMLLQTGNDQIRFKPRPVEGVELPTLVEPDLLLLDGQQRLTSLTQALTGDGVVDTEDSRGKKLSRRYYIDMKTALAGDDHIADAVISIPGDGVVRTDFGKQVELDLSTADKERREGYFPVRLLFGGAETVTWLFACDDKASASQFHAQIVQPTATYNIPAIELDTATSKSAVATVFEKVNTGGLPLNVFELLTATYAGDRAYFERTGKDFRLNDDWAATQDALSAYPVLSGLESTDFLQAVGLLASYHGATATTARKDDILKLELDQYLRWAPRVRDALVWVAGFLDALNIHVRSDLPYPKLLVPLAAIKVELGDDADVHGVTKRLRQWFWCGVLGELYGAAIETRFARDIEQVPRWARATQDPHSKAPRTVDDATFIESRLHSLRTRNAAAYKGVYALLMAQGTKDWLLDKPFDKAYFLDMQVDIHHVFPKAWCLKNGIDAELRESIVNKTPLAKKTNIRLGGHAPSVYLQGLERQAGISTHELNRIIGAHQVDVGKLREDDFYGFFLARRRALTALIEEAMGKPVAHDMTHDFGSGSETSDAFVEMPDDPEDGALGGEPANAPLSD